ncbi:hypothetical protein NDU88_009509 [Pleurodeles waltl]|nr:hypothetical protein NDU88_009509 [Pleurodeles waltl]
MLGLQLLPLSDGTFTRFQDSDEDIALIESSRFQRLLLPGLAQRFVPHDLKPAVLQHLRRIGEKRLFSNLLCLDKEVIVKNLQEALPADWRSGSKEVTWNPGVSHQPPKEWLHAFWNFLRQEADVLSPFEGHPLVPLSPIRKDTTQMELARLTKSTSLLFQTHDGHNLAETTTNVIETIGCTVIRQQDPQVWHNCLSEYVMTPTPNNILKSISNLGVDKVVLRLKRMTSEQKKLFSDVLSQASFLSTNERRVLSQLPIFKNMCSLKSPGSELVAAVNAQAVDKLTVPDIPRDLVLPEMLLICRDENDRRLLLQMEVTFISATEVAYLSAQAIKSGLYAHQQSKAEDIMLWVLRNGGLLFSQKLELRQCCQTLRFIPCDQKLVQPSALFDPRLKIFQDLFPPSRFPPQSYHEPVILDSLKSLGIKDSIEDINPADILQIAEELDKNQQDGQLQGLEKKSRALVKVCNETHVLYIFEQHSLQSLCNLSWVPWNSPISKIVFLKPSQLRSMMYSTLVQLAMPLTDEFNQQASEQLGLNSPPPAEKVIEHLTNLSHQYQTENSYSLVLKLHNIYNHIQNNVCQFLTVLNGIKIWNGEGFSDATDILLSYPEGLDLSCQIKKVPQEFLMYRTIFHMAGVRETMSETEIINMLNELMQDIQNRSSGCGTNDELKLALCIIDWMKRRGYHSMDDLPVPVQAGNSGFTLKPLSTALFCDMPKERLNDLGDELDYNIVHEDITFATATFLKIPLLSTKFLKPEYFEPWGPSEPITLRIKNILKEYSEEVELFKEMIQNADDAGATICNFLVDMRQNLDYRNSLIDPAMTSCHGPALWSYNNSNFSEEDFRNITRVGAATKELQLEKIGKFGLGFNTVYHVTDVPSILSGGSVLIFDPNACHLKKHIQSEANPGLKLNFQKHLHVLQIFKDQFHPYQNVFDCNLKDIHDYNGTLIRLPFRTEEDARDSKICNRSFGAQEIKLLMDTFKESSQNLIIFLKGVQEVTLGYLQPDSSSSEKETWLLKVSKNQIQQLTFPENFLLQKKLMTVTEVVTGNKARNVNESSIIQVTRTENSVETLKYYLVHSSFGIMKSLQTFQESRQNNKKVDLPLAGVALPLMTNIDTGKWRPNLKDFEGQVFCFMPLPIFSGLPFHLNGSFSVMSNRKSLWDTTDKGEWNRQLLRDAVIVACVGALTQLQQMCLDAKMEDYSYYTFWPNIKKSKSVFAEASTAFYRAVAYGIDKNVLKLFSDEHVWCSIEHACFLSCDIVENTEVGEMASHVFSANLPNPFVAVHLPEWVKDGFIASGCGEALLCNTYNWERFYKEIVFTNFDYLPVEARDALIIHAIDMNNKDVDKLLRRVPCIPSTPSGALQLISNLVHPNGNVALLFDKEEGCFPSGTSETYMNSQRLSRLEHLGMLKDNISAEQLIRRANTISEVWKLDKTKAWCRINKVLDILKDTVQKKLCNEYQSMFRRISFLPAVIPPCDTQKDANDIVLKKPTEVFHYKQCSLVNMCEPVLIKEYAGHQFTISSDVMDFLGLRTDPPVPMVMSQLQKTQTNANMFSRHELTQVVRKCYTYLNKHIKDDPRVKRTVQGKAQTFPFVLIGQEFVPLSSIARDVQFEAAPYLYQLPGEYHLFDILWECVGLRERFAFDDYKAVLERMAKRYNGKGLSTKELDLALTIVNIGLKGELKDNTSSHYQVQGLFLPDQDSVMRPADKLHFNDTPWLPYKETLFCHGMIPRAVALTLRVPTKIHKTLQNLKIHSLSQWASSFGAKQDLTRRIKNIIAEYSSKKDILKELIQNADDSGATELHFVWDSRTHPALRTFGENWKSLQGPALCVYNNKVFTNNDIDGIQQLGKGGKGDRLGKTGKYGIGFNSVYHLTDCPSFVTGDSMLCVFDPNLLFLPTADEHSPGAMFSINQEFKSTFADVYSCFLPSLFCLDQGTLFRLPLRTAETVAKSQISDQTVSSHDIEALWGELENNANDLMLFLNNIQKITFSKITETDNKLQNILSIETELKGDCAGKRLTFQEKLNELAEVGQSTAMSIPFQVIYTMIIKCSSFTSSSKWMIARQIGVQEGKCTDLQRVLNSLKYTHVPHGAIAACINSHEKGRAFCTLPLPVETGLPVHISGSFIVDSARRDICKEDGGSGKTEWNSLIMTHLLAPLYSDLLEYMCQDLSRSRQAPIEFENMSACENVLNSHFLRFFPHTSEAVPPMWQKIIGHVYYSIFEKKLQLIPFFRLKTIQIHTFRKETVNVEWSAVGHECGSAEPYFIISDIQPHTERVLHNINMKLVFQFDSLLRVFEELKKAKVNALKVCPESVCNFLKVIRLYPEGDGLPLPVCDTLLKDEFSCSTLLEFCIQVAHEKAEYLNELPIMVTMDGNLGKFQRDSPKFCSMYSDLFPAHIDQFASNNVIKPQHIALLQKEGFLKHFSIQESAGFIKEYLGNRYQILGGNSNGGIKLKTEDKKWLIRVWEYFETEAQTLHVRDKKTSSRLFRDLIAYFSDWAVLPVSSLKCNKDTFLLNLGDCSTIVYEWSDEVAKCLSKLGIFRLNTSLLPFDIGFHCMKPHLLQPNDYAAVLAQLCSRREELHWSELTDRDADYILRILSEYWNTPYKLQYLPLFETIQGSRQCLHMYSKRYILKTRLPSESSIFHELYQIDKQTVFLRENYLYEKLQNDLNIQMFDDVQFLVTFLLPLFTSMVKEQLLKVVDLIQKLPNYYRKEFEAQKPHIFKSLGSIRFIRDRHGTFQLPSYFYNPDNLVFKTFELYERFIPEGFFQQLGYTFPQLKETLLGLGMKSNISDDEFVEFATLVETEARRSTTLKMLKPKSKVLYSHLLQLQVEDLKNDFIS